jgi:drug/metabolite transporter (DMT)-like permease
LLGIPGGPGLAFAVASAATHVAYNVALLRSYRVGGYGRTYPVARGTSPLLVAIGGWLLAGEHLKPLQLAGVATIAAGLFSTVLVSGRPRRDERTAIAVALLTGLTIAGYSVLDGLGARRVGDPIRYVAFLFALQGLAIAAVGFAARRRDTTSVRALDLRAGIAAGTLSVAAYGIVIWAQTRAPLALVSALRETSVISAAIISTIVFHEPVARRRIVPAIAIAAGILAIASASPHGPSRPVRRPVEGSIPTAQPGLTRPISTR